MADPILRQRVAPRQVDNGKHEHEWEDTDEGTRCHICGEFAISEEEAARGLQELF